MLGDLAVLLIFLILLISQPRVLGILITIVVKLSKKEARKVNLKIRQLALCSGKISGLSVDLKNSDGSGATEISCSQLTLKLTVKSYIQNMFKGHPFTLCVNDVNITYVRSSSSKNAPSTRTELPCDENQQSKDAEKVIKLQRLLAAISNLFKIEIEGISVKQKTGTFLDDFNVELHQLFVTPLHMLSPVPNSDQIHYDIEMFDLTVAVESMPSTSKKQPQQLRAHLKSLSTTMTQQLWEFGSDLPPKLQLLAAELAFKELFWEGSLPQMLHLQLKNKEMKATRKTNFTRRKSPSLVAAPLQTKFSISSVVSRIHVPSLDEKCTLGVNFCLNGNFEQDSAMIHAQNAQVALQTSELMSHELFYTEMATIRCTRTKEISLYQFQAEIKPVSLRIPSILPRFTFRKREVDLAAHTSEPVQQKYTKMEVKIKAESIHVKWDTAANGDEIQYKVQLFNHRINFHSNGQDPQKFIFGFENFQATSRKMGSSSDMHSDFMLENDHSLLGMSTKIPLDFTVELESFHGTITKQTDGQPCSILWCTSMLAVRDIAGARFNEVILQLNSAKHSICFSEKAVETNLQVKSGKICYAFDLLQRFTERLQRFKADVTVLQRSLKGERNPKASTNQRSFKMFSKISELEALFVMSPQSQICFQSKGFELWLCNSPSQPAPSMCVTSLLVGVKMNGLDDEIFLIEQAKFVRIPCWSHAVDFHLQIHRSEKGSMQDYRECGDTPTDNNFTLLSKVQGSCIEAFYQTKQHIKQYKNNMTDLDSDGDCPIFMVNLDFDRIDFVLQPELQFGQFIQDMNFQKKALRYAKGKPRRGNSRDLVLSVTFGALDFRLMHDPGSGCQPIAAANYYFETCVFQWDMTMPFGKVSELVISLDSYESKQTFSTIQGGKLSVELGHFAVSLPGMRNKFLESKGLQMNGTLLLANICPTEQTKYGIDVILSSLPGYPLRQRPYTIDQDGTQVKLYLDVKVKGSCFNVAGGPSLSPLVQRMAFNFRRLSPPSTSTDPPLNWWDTLRLLFHGKFALDFQEFQYIQYFRACSSVEDTMILKADGLSLNYSIDRSNLEPLGRYEPLGSFNINTKRITMFLPKQPPFSVEGQSMEMPELFKTAHAPETDKHSFLSVSSGWIAMKVKWSCEGDPLNHHTQLIDQAPTDRFSTFRSQGLHLILNASLDQGEERKTDLSAEESKFVEQAVCIAVRLDLLQWFRTDTHSQQQPPEQKASLLKLLRSMALKVDVGGVIGGVWQGQETSEGFLVNSEGIKYSQKLVKLEQDSRWVSTQKDFVFNEIKLCMFDAFDSWRVGTGIGEGEIFCKLPADFKRSSIKDQIFYAKVIKVGKANKHVFDNFQSSAKTPKRPTLRRSFTEEEREEAISSDNVWKFLIDGLRLHYTLPARDAIFLFVHELRETFGSSKGSVKTYEPTGSGGLEDSFEDSNVLKTPVKHSPGLSVDLIPSIMHGEVRTPNNEEEKRKSFGFSKCSREKQFLDIQLTNWQMCIAGENTSSMLVLEMKDAWVNGQKTIRDPTLENQYQKRKIFMSIEKVNAFLAPYSQIHNFLGLHPIEDLSLILREFKILSSYEYERPDANEANLRGMDRSQQELQPEHFKVQLPEVHLELDRDQFFAVQYLIRYVLLATPPKVVFQEIKSWKKRKLMEKAKTIMVSDPSLESLDLQVKDDRYRLKDILEEKLECDFQKAEAPQKVRVIEYTIGAGTWLMKTSTHTTEVSDTAGQPQYLRVHFRGLSGSHVHSSDLSLLTLIQIQSLEVQFKDENDEEKVLCTEVKEKCGRCNKEFSSEDFCQYHSGTFTKYPEEDSGWSCCKMKAKSAPGCQICNDHPGFNMLTIRSKSMRPVLIGCSVVSVWAFLEISIYPSVLYTLKLKLKKTTANALKEYFYLREDPETPPGPERKRMGLRTPNRKFKKAPTPSKTDGKIDQIAVEKKDDLDVDLQEGIYIRYARFGDINLSIKIDGFKFFKSEKEFQVSISPYLQQRKALTFPWLTKKFVKHIAWCMVRRKGSVASQNTLDYHSHTSDDTELSEDQENVRRTEVFLGTAKKQSHHFQYPGRSAKSPLSDDSESDDESDTKKKSSFFKFGHKKKSNPS